MTDPSATVAEINAISLRQSLAPTVVLGRVNASMRVAQLGAMLAGSLAGGLLGAAFGLRFVLFAAAAGQFAATLPFVLHSRDVRPSAIAVAAAEE